MGTVYKAQKKETGELVALKVLIPDLARKDTQFLERFKREAEAAALVNHTNVVRSLDYGEDKGYHYLAMEYVEGETLQHLIKRSEKLPEMEAVEIMTQLVEALNEIHRAGLVHRDIKPSNLVMTKEGVIKLTDLGVVKFVDAKATLTAMDDLLGSPDYISPELVKGLKDVDIRSDIYSAGVTFYHMLTGSTPYHGENIMELLYKHIEAPTPDPRQKVPTLSFAVASIVKKMMAKNVSQRYQNPDELLSDLRQLRERGPGKTRATKRHHKTRILVGSRSKSRTNLWVAIGGAFAVLLVLLIVALSSTTNNKPNKPPSKDQVKPKPNNQEQDKKNPEENKEEDKPKENPQDEVPLPMSSRVLYKCAPSQHGHGQLQTFQLSESL
jgi:serine/threonine protein kinase